MSDNKKTDEKYYFGEVSKIEIKDNELVDVFAYMYLPGGGGRTPVMVGPGAPSPGFVPKVGVMSPVEY